MTQPPAPLSRRGLFRLGLLAGAGTALASCATPTGLPGPGTLNLALNRSLVSLDNKLNQFDAAVTVQRAVRQGLTRLTPDLKVEPVLAESITLTAPTEWTVKLREGVRYSDGSPVAVDDVAVALESYRDTDGGFLATFFPEWPKVQRLDDRSFKLVTDEPLPILDYLMTNILITPAAANRPEELQTGVGTGPYIVTRSDRGAGTYRLSRNQNYWGGAPLLDQVDVRFLPGESSRVVSLRSGEIDVIDSITPDSVEQLKGLSGVTIETRPGTRLTHLFYNFRKPRTHPLSDVRVREALSYAIDGPSLINDVLQNAVVPVNGVVPPDLMGAAEVGEFRHDPDRARQLLRDLGVNDLQMTIIWESGEFAGDSQVMEAVYEMLRSVGVGVKLQQFEPGGDISAWRQGKGGDWDLLANGYASPTGLAVTMLQGMFTGTPEKEKTRDTYHGYIVPEVTSLIREASSEVDETERADLLRQAQQAVWDTWPAMWAFAPKAVVARRDRVGGMTLGANNSYDLTTVKLAA
ncbi:ABC transporter substrate-binding protein [Kineosporia succinea]|uniref:Peptide/nickel transport system substrate-binding protein n=1 Tax=Kineosporia succinea TaxID=84632 RepID=A0ABT9P8C6_9ACTN|nr:ABC transporter substrate-binding protein [Kineosporia succinea]MDP9828958.1 peptide/nickel transport system substrate-binding protein [Kineosporia succinea]